MSCAEERRDYYVYLHRRKDNDVVFYIGKGRNNRARQNSNRSNGWKDIVDQSGGYVVDFYAKDLSEQEALDLESRLIEYPHEDWKLVNKVVRLNFAVPDIDILKMNLKYDPDSPSGLVWINRTKGNIKKSKVAGCLTVNNKTKAKEWQVRLNGKLFKAHRLVMILNFGEFDPRLVVNHKDCDPSNNLIENLELCTKAENANRQSCHVLGGTKKNNTSGINGLFISNRFSQAFSTVDIIFNGTRYCKYFSHKRYGEETAHSLAVEYLEQVKRINK